jgi:tetraacyldisaccharide-1-P 4'-kinase
MSQSTFARRLLLPLNPLYRMALAVRELRLALAPEPARRLRFPVVSVGNLSTGGAGKTPLTIALAKALKERGVRVDVLSRGYGRQSQQAARVDPDGSAEEFGDEPLVIAWEADVPVYVALERYDAGALAEADAAAAQPASNPELETPEWSTLGWVEEEPASHPGTALVRVKPSLAVEGFSTDEAPDDAAQNGSTSAEQSLADDASSAMEPVVAEPPLSVHLLDDGFQHRQLARDVDILLLNQQDWSDWLLPAGNLREPREALRRATVITIPADEPELEVALAVWGWSGPLWRLHRKMEIPQVRGPVGAFCGIARPQQFFAGLEAFGLEVPLQLAFPDHFLYTREVLDELLTKARAARVTAILTTMKDLVRLGELADLFPSSMPLAAARLRIVIDDEESAVDWLVNRISNLST